MSLKIAIGADHAGFGLKSKLLDWLRSDEAGNHKILDLGTGSDDSTDYPDYAAAVARAVADGRVARGLLLCGTGIGMAIAANKVRGVRAAVAWKPEVAALAAEHNGANVLCLPARFLTLKAAQATIKAFLTTPFGQGRHARRVKKIMALEA